MLLVHGGSESIDLGQQAILGYTGDYQGLLKCIERVNQTYGNVIPEWDVDNQWKATVIAEYNDLSDMDKGIAKINTKGTIVLINGDGKHVFNIYYLYEYDASLDSEKQQHEKLEVEVPADMTINTGRVAQQLTEVTSTAQQLKNVVSSWYFILRNFALLVLMLILIYIGIRIVIGSTAGEKAKYKERLMDWLVAVCLIMIMHYIMVFAVGLVQEITELVKVSGQGKESLVYIQLTQTQSENIHNAAWSDFSVYQTSSGNMDLFTDNNGDGWPDFVQDDDNSESKKAIYWRNDLLGLFRLQAQLEKEGTLNWIGYSFCYVILVLFIVFFGFTYTKRVLYMAFLTIIAPLVAMTYPIDKITDGKAQAFDAWLKEYIFNLMIQPLHLLLYTILVTSAFELAATNAIYGLVAIGFMMPAEKLMRRFFGFEKAKTPGLLGGAAGAAIAMSGMQSLLKPKHKGGNNSGKGQNQGQEQGKVKFAHKNNVDSMDAIVGENRKNGNNGNESGGNNPGGNDPGGNPPSTELPIIDGEYTVIEESENSKEPLQGDYEVVDESRSSNSTRISKW